MSTVKVLIDGVGEWEKGAVVKDAPPGLVHMATVGTRNAATGQLVAELVEESTIEEMNALQAKAKALKIKDYTKMSVSDLEDAIAGAEKAIADAEEAEKQKQQAEEALKQLQAKAAELKIEGAEAMTIEQLTAAIEAAGGGNGGQ